MIPSEIAKKTLVVISKTARNDSGGSRVSQNKL